jgi:hypothetical protein
VSATSLTSDTISKTDKNIEDRHGERIGRQLDNGFPGMLYQQRRKTTI